MNVCVQLWQRFGLYPCKTCYVTFSGPCPQWTSCEQRPQLLNLSDPEHCVACNRCTVNLCWISNHISITLFSRSLVSCVLRFIYLLATIPCGLLPFTPSLCSVASRCHCWYLLSRRLSWRKRLYFKTTPSKDSRDLFDRFQCVFAVFPPKAVGYWYSRPEESPDPLVWEQWQV